MGGLVTTPFDQGRGTLAIAGRYSYTGALASLFFSDVQLGYADYQVRLEHPFAGGRLTLLAMGSADELALRVNAIGDGALQFHRIDLRWDRALGPGRLRLRGTVGTDWARRLDVLVEGLVRRVDAHGEAEGVARDADDEAEVDQRIPLHLLHVRQAQHAHRELGDV